MQVYKMKKPSANMNISMTELLNKQQEANKLLYESAQEQQEAYSCSVKLEQSESANYVASYYTEMTQREAQSNKKAQYLRNVKTALLSECLCRLYKESSISPLTTNDQVIMKNMVNRFIVENGGVNRILSDFKYKSLMLSEFARIVNKYSDIVVESGCKDCEDQNEYKEFIFDTDTKDDFFEELKDVDIDDASKLIRDRISDAMSEFINTNTVNKMDYEEVIAAAQDKIVNTQNESYIDIYSQQAKRKINEMKLQRKKNIFHCIVEALATKSVKDPELKARFVNEATIDMDAIVENAQLLYTMLEMVNTTNMITIDEKYMDNYIKSLYV